jgi:hypothetical protein
LLLSSLQSTPLPPALADGREEIKTCFDLLSADPLVWKDVTDRVRKVEEVRVEWEWNMRKQFAMALAAMTTI